MKKSNRRVFLKSAGLAAGTLALPSFSITRSAWAAHHKINVAVVGAGGMGRYAVRQGASENLVALCDVDDARAAAAFKEHPQARRFKDFRVMLDKMWKEIDAVAVSTPDHTHFAAAMDAMERGKHVFVQKPLAHNVRQLRALRKAAKHYNVITQMGNQGHTFNGMRRIKEWVGTGVISLPVSRFASPQGFFTGGSRADTDQDGLTDGFELLVSKTNPTNPDSAVDRNGDGQIDAFTGLAGNGVYDSEEDFEPDNLRNEAEYYLGTNPFRSDSDNDGTNDSDEDFNNDGITDYEDYLDIVVTLEPGYHESSVILNTVGTASELSVHAGVAVSGYGNTMVALSVSVPGDNQLKITSQMFVSRSGGAASSTSSFIPLSPRNLPDDPYDPPPGYVLANHPDAKKTLTKANGDGWSDPNYRVLPRINHDLYDDLSEDFLRKAASEAYYGRQRQKKRIAILIQQGHDEDDRVVRKLR